MVGAVGEAEVGAAVEHVDVDGRPGGQQPVQVRGGVGRVPHMVRTAPVVEPADPELRAEQRLFALVLAQPPEALLDAAAEGAGSQEARHASGGQMFRVGLVAGEQQFLDPRERNASARCFRYALSSP